MNRRGLLKLFRNAPLVPVAAAVAVIAPHPWTEVITPLSGPHAIKNVNFSNVVIDADFDVGDMIIESVREAMRRGEYDHKREAS